MRFYYMLLFWKTLFGKDFRPCLVDALVMAFYFDLLLSRHLCRAFLLGKAFVFVLKYKNDLAGR